MTFVHVRINRTIWMPLGAMDPIAWPWKPTFPLRQYREDLLLALRAHQWIQRHHYAYGSARTGGPQRRDGMSDAVSFNRIDITPKDLMNPSQWPQLNLGSADMCAPTSATKRSFSLKEASSPLEITGTNRHRSSFRGQGEMVVDEACRQISPRLILSPLVISQRLADTRQYSTGMVRNG
jgi:hypothetical protein